MLSTGIPIRVVENLECFRASIGECRGDVKVLNAVDGLGSGDLEGETGGGGDGDRGGDHGGQSRAERDREHCARRCSRSRLRRGVLSVREEAVRARASR